MDLNYINIMLYITGIFTATTGLAFFIPEFFLDKMLKIQLADEASILIARHWALLVGLIGSLIICSVHSPEIRNHILIAAVIGKAAIVIMILKDFKRDYTNGLRGVVVFYTTCVVLYLLVLFGIT